MGGKRKGSHQHSHGGAKRRHWWGWKVIVGNCVHYHNRNPYRCGGDCGGCGCYS